MAGGLGAVRVRVVGVPVDLGAGRRGTDMGPSALRYARLHEVIAGLGHEAVDAGNIEVPVPEARSEPRQRLRYLPEIAAACGRLAESVRAALAAGAMPLVLGGDHSLTIGVLAGRRLAGRQGGVVWLDAHGDFNTEATTPSGNIHGMALAVATGRGAPELVALGPGPTAAEDRAVLVGVRALDAPERAAIHASRVTVLTMKEIDQRGAGPAVARAIGVASAGGRLPFHLSVDLDVLDPLYAPGVGTPVPGGITYREAHLAMELLADSGLVDSVDVVELNPILDERNRTAALAVELVASLLGRRIY